MCVCIYICVTGSGKTGLIHTSTEIQFLSTSEKVHSCTTQKHQVFGNRWPGLLLQMAFCRCCKTTKVHFMVLGRINRTAWGTKLLLTAVWASLVDFTSSRHLLKAQHCSLSPNGCFAPPSAPHPPPTRPPPIESIRDITGAEKKLSKNQQHPSSFLE